MNNCLFYLPINYPNCIYTRYIREQTIIASSIIFIVSSIILIQQIEQKLRYLGECANDPPHSNRGKSSIKPLGQLNVHSGIHVGQSIQRPPEIIQGMRDIQPCDLPGQIICRRSFQRNRAKLLNGAFQGMKTARYRCRKRCGRGKQGLQSRVNSCFNLLRQRLA